MILIWFYLIQLFQNSPETGLFRFSPVGSKFRENVISPVGNVNNALEWHLEA